MPRTAVPENSRLALRLPASDKATLLRAVALEHTDMTEFILQHALDAARRVIAHSEHLKLTERDSLRVLAALEKPAAPNSKLRAAAKRLPKVR